MENGIDGGGKRVDGQQQSVIAEPFALQGEMSIDPALQAADPISASVYLDPASEKGEYVARMAGRSALFDGPNCYGAALMLPEVHMVEEEAQYLVKRGYVPTTHEALKPGDVLVFDNYDHMAMYVGEKDGVPMVFHKANWKHQSFYEIVPLDDAVFRSELAHYQYVIDKWDRIGKPVPTKEKMRPPKITYFTPADGAVSAADAKYAEMGARYEPLLQFHSLRMAALTAISPFIRPYLTMIKSAQFMYGLVDKELRITSNVSKSVADQMLELPTPFAEGVLRLKSLVQQLELVVDYYDPINDRNVSFKPLRVLRESFVGIDTSLRSELLLYAISLGVAPHQVTEVVDRAQAAIAGEYASMLGRIKDPYAALSASLDVYQFVVDEAKKAKRRVGASLGMPDGTGASLVFTPLDVMMDPYGIEKMLGGGARDVVLRPVEHGVFTDSLRVLAGESAVDKQENMPSSERIKAAIRKAEEIRVFIDKAEGSIKRAERR